MKLTKNRSTPPSSQSSGDKDLALPHGGSSYTSSAVSPQAGDGGSSGSIVLPHSHSTMASGRAVASGGAIASGGTVASGAAAPPHSHGAVAFASGGAVMRNHHGVASGGAVARNRHGVASGGAAAQNRGAVASGSAVARNRSAVASGGAVVQNQGG